MFVREPSALLSSVARIRETAAWLRCAGWAGSVSSREPGNRGRCCCCAWLGRRGWCPVPCTLPSCKPLCSPTCTAMQLCSCPLPCACSDEAGLGLGRPLLAKVVAKGGLLKYPLPTIQVPTILGWAGWEGQGLAGQIGGGRGEPRGQQGGGLGRPGGR